MESTLFPIQNNAVDHLFTDPQSEIETLSSTINWYDFYAFISLVAFTALSIGALYITACSFASAIPCVLVVDFYLFELFQSWVYSPLKAVSTSSQHQFEFLTKVQEEIKKINTKPVDSTLNNLGIINQGIDPERNCIPLLARAKVYDSIAQEYLKQIASIYFTPSNNNSDTPNYKALVIKAADPRAPAEERVKHDQQILESNKHWHELENRFIIFRFHSIFCAYIATLYLHNQEIALPRILNRLRNNAIALAANRHSTPNFLNLDAPIFSHGSTHFTRSNFRYLSLRFLITFVRTTPEEQVERLLARSPSLLHSYHQLLERIQSLIAQSKTDDEIAESLTEFDDLLMCKELQTSITTGINYSMIEYFKRMQT